MTKLYSVNTKLCISCGKCALDCPTKAIAPDEDGKYVINQKRCIGCGHCGAVCPSNAVKFNNRDLTPWKDPKIAPEKVLQLIVGKRSMRRYQKKNIPKSVMKDILYAGSMTATATNSQDWQAHIYTGKEEKHLIEVASESMCRRLKKINTPIGRQLAKMVGFGSYAKKDFLEKAIKGYEKGIDGKKDPFFFDAPCVVIITSPRRKKNMARINGVMAATHMMLYANSLGIGSCFIGFLDIAISKNKKARREIGIGDDRSISAVFSLGYSDQKYIRLPERRNIMPEKK